MAWNNPRLRLYHGSNTNALPVKPSDHLNRLRSFSVNVSLSKRAVDFGQGFYTTTNLEQAREWANESVRKLATLRPPVRASAIVLAFEVDRDVLASMNILGFVAPTDDFFDFVEHCRLRPGSLLHMRTGPNAGKGHYDIVFGPVALGFQKLVLHNCDQVSFHDQQEAAKVLVNPVVLEYSFDADGLLR